jgi:hypothetical protein
MQRAALGFSGRSLVFYRRNRDRTGGNLGHSPDGVKHLLQGYNSIETLPSSARMVVSASGL